MCFLEINHENGIVSVINPLLLGQEIREQLGVEDLAELLALDDVLLRQSVANSILQSLITDRVVTQKYSFEIGEEWSTYALRKGLEGNPNNIDYLQVTDWKNEPMNA